MTRPTLMQATFSREKVLLSSALIILAALIPFIYPSAYGIGVLVTMLVFVVLNISWNFLLGIAGVWNFGQLAMFAVGGYGGGLLIIHLSLSPWLAIIVGGIAGAALAIVIAIPTLRLYGIYTSLLTFAAAQVVQLVIQNDTTGTTGGALGMPSVQGLFTSLSPLWSARAYYWLLLAVVVIATIGSVLLTRAPFGLALRTMRDSLAYGSARGIDPLRYRVMAFAVSGFLAGVAGMLYTLYNGSISPAVMGLTPMSIYVTMMVVGGLGTIAGPIVGTIVLTAVQQALIDHPGTQLTVLGVVLIAIVVFVPRGIAFEVGRVRDRIVRWMNEEETVPPAPPTDGDGGAPARGSGPTLGRSTAGGAPLTTQEGL